MSEHKAKHNKVALIGNLAGGNAAPDGQTVRTRLVDRELKKRLGEHRVLTVDTVDIRLRPIKAIMAKFKAFRVCENVIIMPGIRGLRWLLPLFVYLSRRYGCRLHYFVVGGWLPEFLEEHPSSLKKLLGFAGIYVQSHRMKRQLAGMGLQNVHYLPNFREFSLEFVSSRIVNEPLSLVFLSRLIPEKRVNDCIDAVLAVNHSAGQVVCTLDIWGPLSGEHRAWFDSVMPNRPDIVNYCGIASPEAVQQVLTKYDAMVFPTSYSGEGFPGVILDAFSAGIPVIASDWQDNAEVITEGETGLLFRTGDTKHLQERIRWLLDNPVELVRMKAAAYDNVRQYHVDVLLPPLLDSMSLTTEGNE